MATLSASISGVKLGRHSRTALETANGPQNFVNFGELTAKSRTVIFTHDLSWWLVGKPIADLLFALIWLFRYLLGFGSYAAKCVQLGCFHKGVDFCSQFSSGHCHRHQPFLASENYTVSQKVHTFKLSVTLSNLNRFSKLLHCWKAYEICYKTHSTLPALP